MVNFNRQFKRLLYGAALVLLILSAGCKVIPESAKQAGAGKGGIEKVAAVKVAADAKTAPAAKSASAKEPAADAKTAPSAKKGECDPGDSGVTFYADINFKGKCQVLPLGKTKDFANLKSLDGAPVQSIQLGKASSVVLYPKPNLAGKGTLVQEDVKDLAYSDLSTFASGSIKVIERILAPVEPEILLPEQVALDQAQTITWTAATGVKYTAELTGPDKFQKSMPRTEEGSWAVGQLLRGKYTFTLTATNQAGSASASADFRVVKHPKAGKDVVKKSAPSAATAQGVQTHLEALPTLTNSTAILVKWVVDSGVEQIDHFHLQWRKGLNDWQDWTEPLLPGDTSLILFGAPDKKFDFRIRAITRDGKDELFPETIEASTTVVDGCSRDQYEGAAAADNALAGATALTLGEEQTHNWCPVGDRDWVSFKAAKGDRLHLVVKPIGLASAATVTLASGKGKVFEKASPKDVNGETTLDYKVPASGTYLVKFEPLEPALGGVDTNYTLSVERRSRVSPLILLLGLAAILLILAGVFILSREVRKRTLTPVVAAVGNAVEGAKGWVNQHIYRYKI